MIPVAEVSDSVTGTLTVSDEEVEAIRERLRHVAMISKINGGGPDPADRVLYRLLKAVETSE